MKDAGIKNIKNILIIKLSSIGDCLLATPAIESIRKAYPESFITWLIEDKSKDIALLNPYVNEVVVIDKKNFKLSDYYDLIKYLRSKKYGMSIDLQGVDRTSVYSFLSGAKLRYVEEYANLGFLSNRKISRKGKPLEHAVKFYLFLAQACGGIIPQEIKLTFVTEKKDREFALDFLSNNFNHAISGGLFVGMNPGGAWNTKKWPAEYFIVISKMLISKLNTRIVLFGAGNENYLAENIINAVKDNVKDKDRNSIISACGKTSLKEAKELIAAMDYFISGDSSLIHIASSIENGPKVIAIFGSTDPGLTGPISKNSRVLRADIDCSPCFKKDCPLIKIKGALTRYAPCMKKITPDDVFDIINGNITDNDNYK